VKIEFDDVKDAANLAKHGVSLALGAVILANAIGEIVMTGGITASSG